MEIKINRDGAEFGPFTLEQVNQMLEEGSLLPTDLAWHDPMETWAELSHVAATINQTPETTVEDEDPSSGEFRGGGRYKIIKQLGRGGMGVVYLAMDTQLNEELALKSFPPEMAVDEAALDDMKREVQKSRKLSHPNIIRIHDLVNLPDEDPFLTMEFVEGQELADMRRDQEGGVFAWEDLKDYIVQLCDALTTAHAENTVHRDLKPTQMMINKEGRLKLCDFGIAASMADSLSFSSMKHAVSGTLLFMSPQQMNGEVPRAADDIYALGATLYDLMTGKPPFYTGNVNVQVMTRPAVSMKERLEEFGIDNDIPDYVDQLVLSCLAKEADHRPASAEEIKDWILTEGGAASLKTVRIPLWGGKVVDVDRKKLTYTGITTGILAAGFLAYTILKPAPFFEKTEIQQEVNEGLLLHLALDRSSKANGNRVGTLTLKLAGDTQIIRSENRMVNVLSFVPEQRDSAAGINLQDTNYVTIGPNTHPSYINNYRQLRDLQNKDYTLSLWYKPFSVPKDEDPTELQHGLIVKPGFHIGLTYSSDKKFTMSHQWKNEADENKLTAAISKWSYGPNNWYHVVGTVNRKEGIVALYVNGKEAGTATFDANAPPYEKFGLNSWYVGAGNPKGKYSWFCDGAIDEVRFYNKAMDLETVQKLYSFEQPDPYGDGLMVFMPFDGDLENAIQNIGYNGVEHTNQPAMTRDRFGNPNSAYLFDGNMTQHIHASAASSTDTIAQGSGSRTLCAWFKPDDLGDNTQFIIGWGSNSGDTAPFALRVATNRINAHVRVDKTFDMFADKISEGNWYHAALSYNDENNMVRLYLNGEAIAMSTNVLATSGSTLKVGGTPFVATNAFFTGVIDEVRVYNKPLRPEVIKIIYSSGKPASTWYWYVLGSMLLLVAVAYYLYRKGYRIPSKYLDPVLLRLPEKLATALLKLREEEQEPEMEETVAPA